MDGEASGHTLSHSYIEPRRPDPQDGFNEGSIEIIQDKLYWISSELPPFSEESDDSYYFSTDNLPELDYDPFHKDFGPLKLSMVHRYC